MASLPRVSPTLFLIVFSVLLLISLCEGREFLVGGSEASWKVPGPSPDWLNQWAGTQRFRIGDALLFKYDNGTESVHLVNKEDYVTCTTEGKNHTVFKDGISKVWLLNSGPLHFISGTEGHCNMGLKLAVVVMSARHSPPVASSSSSPSPLSSHSALPPTINQAVPRTSRIQVIMGLGVSLVMIMFLI